MRKHLKSTAALLLTASLSLSVLGCGDDDPVQSNARSIVETAAAAGQFTTLVAALEATGLDATLSGNGPFTVFAPTDAAFAALPAGTVDALLADPDALSKILTYHVASGNIGSADLNGVTSAITVNGLPVLFDLTSGVKVNGARVTTADIQASNGVIHVIDAVLLPPSQSIVDVALGNPNFSTLVTALTAADLVTTLQGPGPYTVFAPTNAAFAALPAGTVEALLGDIPALTNILLYHVAGGRAFSGDLDGSPVSTLQGSTLNVDLSSGVRINGATVVTADILTTNGVIHVIDSVLLP